MADRTFSLDRNGSLPIVDVIIGQAQFGRYRFSLWDNTGHNPQPLAEGINTDQLADQFTVDPTLVGAPAPTVANLDRRFLDWDVLVAPFDSGANQLFAVVIRVMQDGRMVGLVTEAGTFEGPKILSGHARFAVA